MNDWFTLSLLIFAGVVVFLIVLIYLRERRLIKYCEQIIKKIHSPFIKLFQKLKTKSRDKPFTLFMLFVVMLMI